MSDVLWLYALAAAPLPAAPPRGATGEALVAHPIPGGSDEGLALWVLGGELEAALRPGEGALRAHERVVRGLAAALDPLLPVRFGQTVATAGELPGLLAPRRAALLAALAHVTGCRQVTLRVRAGGEEPDDEDRGPADDDPGAGPGTRYLLARRRAAEVAPPAAVRPLLALLAPLVRDQRTAAASAPFALSVYHLVESARLEAYLSTLAGSVGGAEATSSAVSWSGPWPPWAFAPGLGG